MKARKAEGGRFKKLVLTSCSVHDGATNPREDLP
jgi:hypothetical protein